MAKGFYLKGVHVFLEGSCEALAEGIAEACRKKIPDARPIPCLLYPPSRAPLGTLPWDAMEKLVRVLGLACRDPEFPSRVSLVADPEQRLWALWPCGNGVHGIRLDGWRGRHAHALTIIRPDLDILMSVVRVVHDQKPETEVVYLEDSGGHLVVCAYTAMGFFRVSVRTDTTSLRLGHVLARRDTLAGGTLDAPATLRWFHALARIEPFFGAFPSLEASPHGSLALTVRARTVMEAVVGKLCVALREGIRVRLRYGDIEWLRAFLALASEAGEEQVEIGIQKAEAGTSLWLCCREMQGWLV